MSIEAPDRPGVDRKSTRPARRRVTIRRPRMPRPAIGVVLAVIAGIAITLPMYPDMSWQGIRSSVSHWDHGYATAPAPVVAPYVVPSPAPSPDYAAPKPEGTTPLPGITPGSVGDLTVTSDTTKALLLQTYRIKPGTPVTWDQLIPASLGGDLSPRNVWPMTSPHDGVLKAQLVGWILADLQARDRMSLTMARSRIAEYWDWWGAGGYDDPAAADRWNPDGRPLYTGTNGDLP